MKPLCCVLGGDGFLGSHLVDGLVRQGFSVRVVDRFLGNKSVNLESHLRKGKITTVVRDLFHKSCSFDFLKDVEYLFHFAAASTPTSSQNASLGEYRYHFMPTVSLFKEAKDVGVKRILFPSSGGTIYGETPECPAKETQLPHPNNPHAIAKLGLEKYLECMKGETDSIVYRIANAYGARQRGWITGQGVVSVFLRAALLDEKVNLRDGSSIRDFLYIDDLISLILKSFDTSHHHHVYNAGSGKGTSLSQLVSTIETVTERKLQLTNIESPPTETRKIFLDTDRARKEFNWNPEVSLQTGITRTWRWILMEEQV